MQIANHPHQEVPCILEAQIVKHSSFPAHLQIVLQMETAVAYVLKGRRSCNAAHFLDVKPHHLDLRFFSDKVINASLLAISNCTSRSCAYRLTGDYSFIRNINSSRQISKHQVACYTGWSTFNKNKYATFVNNTDTNGYPICLYGEESVLSFSNIISIKSTTNNKPLFGFGHGGNAKVSNCLFLDSKHDKIFYFYSPEETEIIKFSNCWFDFASETMTSCTTTNVVFSTNKDYIEFSYDVTCKNIPFSQRACKNSHHASYIYFYILIVLIKHYSRSAILIVNVHHFFLINVN